MALVPEFQTSPGMRDILPPESARWRRFVHVFAQVSEGAGYGQVISPLLEDLGVFQRTRGGQLTTGLINDADQVKMLVVAVLAAFFQNLVNIVAMLVLMITDDRLLHVVRSLTIRS